MARTGPSVGNSRTQRINQARFGDISVRYGKDKRSNVNRTLPSPLKTKFHGSKMEKKGFSGSKSSPRQRVSRENYNKNRITFGKFVKLCVLASILAFCVWAYVTYDKGAVYQRHRRSVSDIWDKLSDKYIEGTKSAAAWTRQLRSKGAHSDDMYNPHNGVSNDESIIQKVLSDFAKLVKSESEGYSSYRNEQNYVDNSNFNDL